MIGFGGPPAAAKLRSTCQRLPCGSLNLYLQQSFNDFNVGCALPAFNTTTLMHKISQITVLMLFHFLDTEDDQREDTDRERGQYQHGLSGGDPNA